MIYDPEIINYLWGFSGVNLKLLKDVKVSISCFILFRDTITFIQTNPQFEHSFNFISLQEK